MKWVGDRGIYSIDEPGRARDHWQPSADCGEVLVAMALDEESVLEVAYEHAPLKRLSRECALACTSRYLQRQYLENAGLNPDWTGMLWKQGFYKAPASTWGQGVWPARMTEQLEGLERYAPWLMDRGVWEEHVPGPQYEVDGFVLEAGDVTLFHPLEQVWDAERSRILAYSRAESQDGLLESVEAGVEALQMSWTPFCFEMRRHPDGRWIVIEAHARLGSDPGLQQVMSDMNPLRRIELAVQAELGETA